MSDVPETPAEALAREAEERSRVALEAARRALVEMGREDTDGEA